MVIKHPTTDRLTNFYPSSDGFLREGPIHEGSPTGPRLPAFSSRGDRNVPLNPIFVNDAAAIRLRRLDRRRPGWRETLDEEAQKILVEVETLRKAVIWEPARGSLEQISTSGDLPLEAPDSQSSVHYHQPLPPASGEPAQFSSRPPGGPKGSIPTMSWRDAEKLIHTGNFPS